LIENLQFFLSREVEPVERHRHPIMGHGRIGGELHPALASGQALVNKGMRQTFATAKR
jgi:hypothetical protein